MNVLIFNLNRKTDNGPDYLKTNHRKGMTFSLDFCISSSHLRDKNLL